MDPEQLLRAMFEQISPWPAERPRRLLAALGVQGELGRGIDPLGVKVSELRWPPSR